MNLVLEDLRHHVIYI